MVIIIALLTFYVFVLLQLIKGLHLLKKGRNKTKPVVSVIVAARNEEQNIGNCLNSLISQDYPSKKLEIIIVDDRSTDATADMVKKFTKVNTNVSLIQIKKLALGIAPKKHALDIGINCSKGEIIFITDADCTPKAGWVKSMVNYFEPNIGLVAGFSPLDRAEKTSVFTKLIRLDSLALAAVAAGSFGAGFPLTCNARNLAFRKSLYHQVGGYKQIGHVISGDDDLFLHLIRKKTNWQVHYAIDQQSIISSIAPSTFKDFFYQRIRHASKGRYYSLDLKLSLVAVYLLNLSLLLLCLMSFWKFNFFLLFLISFALKTLFELILLHKAATIFSCEDYLKYFPLAVVFHIPYVTILGLWGQLGKFNWKGEIFHAKLKPTTDLQR